MRVFEHCEACPAPCDGGAVTRSMRRVAHPTLYCFSAGGAECGVRESRVVPSRATADRTQGARGHITIFLDILFLAADICSYSISSFPLTRTVRASRSQERRPLAQHGVSS